MAKEITGEIRFAEIIETPEPTVGEYEKVRDVPRWKTTVKFYQKVDGKTEHEAFFPPWHVPTERVGDRVLVAKRKDWEVVTPAVRGIGRIADSTELSPNRWKYTVTLAKFGCSIVSDEFSPKIEEELKDEIPYDALNLYEVENAETGLMGNGMDLTGYVEENSSDSSLAPAPNGALVWVTGYYVKTEEGEGEDEGEGGESVDGFLFVFEYRNQYVCPFASHLVGKTKTDITGPDAETEVTIDGEDWKFGDDDDTIKVKCPLLGSGETLEKNTLVILSFNIRTKEWEIIEAQCPVEESSSSSDNNRGST